MKIDEKEGQKILKKNRVLPEFFLLVPALFIFFAKVFHVPFLHQLRPCKIIKIKCKGFIGTRHEQQRHVIRIFRPGFTALRTLREFKLISSQAPDIYNIFIYLSVIIMNKKLFFYCSLVLFALAEISCKRKHVCGCTSVSNQKFDARSQEFVDTKKGAVKSCEVYEEELKRELAEDAECKIY